MPPKKLFDGELNKLRHESDLSPDAIMPTFISPHFVATALRDFSLNSHVGPGPRAFTWRAQRDWASAAASRPRIMRSATENFVIPRSGEVDARCPPAPQLAYAAAALLFINTDANLFSTKSRQVPNARASTHSSFHLIPLRSACADFPP